MPLPLLTFITEAAAIILFAFALWMMLRSNRGDSRMRIGIILVFLTAAIGLIAARLETENPGQGFLTHYILGYQAPVFPDSRVEAPGTPPGA